MCVECSGYHVPVLYMYVHMYILQGWIPFRCCIYMLIVCNDHHCTLSGVPGRTLVWRTINPFAQYQPQPMEGNPDNRNHNHQERFLSPHTYPISRFPLSQKIAAQESVSCGIYWCRLDTRIMHGPCRQRGCSLHHASPLCVKATCICVCMHSRWSRRLGYLRSCKVAGSHWSSGGCDPTFDGTGVTPPSLEFLYFLQ
jgi:hypothetical protein